MSQTTSEKLGVIIPSYNEAESIVSLIEAILKTVPQSQVIVVDDSKDLATAEAVRGLGKNNVEVIHRSVKGGRGSAVLVGMQYLLERGCERIVEMDADFSHPPSQITELVEYAQKHELDLLIASRYLPESQILNWPLSRRVFSRCSNLLARTLLRVPIHDYTNGYRCYSKRAADLIVRTCGVYGKGFIALSEILVNVYFTKGLKMKVGEVPTVFVNRVRGESSVNHAEISGALVGLFKIYGLKRRLIRE